MQQIDNLDLSVCKQLYYKQILKVDYNDFSSASVFNPDDPMELDDNNIIVVILMSTEKAGNRSHGWVSYLRINFFKLLLYTTKNSLCKGSLDFS